MYPRRWTKIAFVALFPFLLLGLGRLARAAQKAQPTPHEAWRAAVAANLESYQPTPLDRMPQTALPGEPATAAPEAPSDLLAHERMVFQDARDRNWELYAVDGLGAPVRLTYTPDFAEMHARLSPDGQRIVFAGNRHVPDRLDIYTMAFDGSDVRRLTANDSDDAHPFWSPDGSRIAFEAYRDGQPEIYVMNADGSNQQRLTASGGYDGQPVWSPDGQWIAFVSTRGGDTRLYRMDPAGGQLQMIPTQVEAAYPAWSPNSQQIAFSSDANGDGWLDIWTTNLAGTIFDVRVTSSPDRDAWVSSWLLQAAGQTLTYTSIGFIYYEGEWYWTDASLRRLSWGVLYGNPYTTDGALLYGSDSWWYPDMVSTDHLPPLMPPLSYARTFYFGSIWMPFEEAVDAGSAGLWGYEYAWQRYPDGPWQESTLASMAPPLGLEASPPLGQFQRVRIRALDLAGNVSDWEYSRPVVAYGNDLASTVVDNRGVGIPDVTITTAPATFLKTYEGDGFYHSYTDEMLLNFGAGQISWSHTGFGNQGPWPFMGWADQGRFDFYVVLPPADDVVINGDFATGDLAGWTVSGPLETSPETQQLYVYGPDAVSISQTVTMPATMVNPTLSFLYLMPTGGGQPFLVELVDDQDQATVLYTLDGTASFFEQVWVDLAPWAGETVTLRFRREAAFSQPTVVLDDISLGSALPDVWLEASGLPVAQRGETVALVLDYGNRGAVPAGSTTLTYALPAGLTFVAADPAPASISPLRWELGELAPDGEGRITLTVTVKNTAPALANLGTAALATPAEAITGNNAVQAGVFVGGRVFVPVVSQ